MASHASLSEQEQSRRLYRTIWRWHFYAGVFCIPLVLWLACTGSIYLFKPQIERYLDKPFDHLPCTGERASPESIARAAVAAVPGSSLHFYELPPGSDAAVRVVVGSGKQEFRVYVHPQTLAILNIVNEDRRPMRILFYLHGELLAGELGSYLVELAASWAIVLLLTGLYLWWPRQTERLAGVLWVRTGKGQRIFWRDVHAVTGVWVSAFALFLILTGLPWAKGWGGYFKKIRQVTGATVARQDWNTSRAEELSDRVAMNANSLHEMDDMPEMGHYMGSAMHHGISSEGYASFNRLLPVAESLRLAAPVQIVPAVKPGDSWTILSDAQNRTLRDVISVDPRTGAIVSRQNFRQRQFLDRLVGVGVAAHEGQLFGLFNQLLGLVTCLGLVLLCISATILWWRRRHVGVLGAPLPNGRPRLVLPLAASILALAIYLPAMAVSLFSILLLERLLLSRIAPASRWLGLSSS